MELELENLLGFAENVGKDIYAFAMNYFYFLVIVVILILAIYTAKKIRRILLVKILERECIKKKGTVSSKKEIYMTYKYGKVPIKVCFCKRGGHQPTRTEITCELKLKKNVLFMIKRRGFRTTIDYRKLKPIHWKGIDELYEVRGNDEYFMVKLLDDNLKGKIFMLRDKIMQISLTGSVYDKHELKIIIRGIIKREEEFKRIFDLVEFLINRVREPSLIPIG